MLSCKRKRGGAKDAFRPHLKIPPQPYTDNKNNILSSHVKSLKTHTQYSAQNVSSPAPPSRHRPPSCFTRLINRNAQPFPSSTGATIPFYQKRERHLPKVRGELQASHKKGHGRCQTGRAPEVSYFQADFRPDGPGHVTNRLS